MKKKVKARVTIIANIYIDETYQGEQELEDIDDILDVEELEVLEEIY